VAELRAPFAYPGGKSAVVDICWRALGVDVPAYVEPCAGSAAMLFGRPRPGKYETINDASGLVTNVWRAIQRYPHDVARYAFGPPNELDLRAYATSLREATIVLPGILGKDPTWCDAMLAGRWIYCQSLAFSPDWLTQAAPAAHKPNRKGIFGISGEPLERWLWRISQRLSKVLIACGDWSRVTTETALGFNTCGTTPCAIFFDPPYSDEDLDYGSDPDVAQRVAAWCAEHGDDKRLRIVLAGHVGDYDLPGWHVVNWGGSRGHGRARRGDNEALWFSPHCLPLEQQRGLFDLQDREKLHPADQPPVMKGLP
jgi:hypothetical protein